MTTYSSILAWRILRNRWAWWAAVCCRKGDTFQGPKAGSCLTLRNELSEETHLLTKQEILLGRGAPAESSRVREPRRITLTHGLQSRVLWWMDKFPCCLGHSFWVLPGSPRIAQPRWMPVRSILGGDWTRGVTFWPFPNSSSWWWLISSVFLTRTSCCKTTHTNGYYGVWPRWAVSVSVLPLTVHGVTKSQTRLRLSTSTLNEIYWLRNRLLPLKWKYLLAYQ